MRRIILLCIVQQLLFFTSIVESLEGVKIEDADNHKFPFVASLQSRRGEHLCSGTLITNTHVVTAAYCLKGEHFRGVVVVLGAADLRNATTVRYDVASWTTYGDWINQIQSQKQSFDIAIVRLMVGSLEPHVRPVRLSNLNKQQIQGKKARIIGWGRRIGIRTLAMAHVNILSDDDCNRSIRLINNYDWKIPDTMLCTASQPHVLVQRGDGGGPLLDGSGDLVGVHLSVSLGTDASRRTFSDEFLNPYKSRVTRAESEAASYLEYHHIGELFGFLMAHLVAEQPSDPVAYLFDLLDKCLLFRDGLVEPPLLFAPRHIESMYNSLDPAGVGHISLSQYAVGMKTLGIDRFNACPMTGHCDRVDKDTFLREAKSRLVKMLKEMITEPCEC